MATITTKPKIILRGGKQKAVILDIRDYERLLEASEDREDAAELRRIKKGGTSFRELKEYLHE